MGEIAPGTIKRKGDLIAIKTDPSVTAGAWFVFHPANGGGYTDGVAQHIEDFDGGWEVV